MRTERFPPGAAVSVEQLEGDPHALLARLRADEPVSWLPAIGGWLVTRRDLALAAMRDAAAFTVQDPRFTTAQVVGPSMLSLDGPEHDRHRAPFVAPLRLGAVRETLAAAVREEAGLLLDRLEPAGEAELRRGFAGPLAAAVVTRALGLSHADVDAVLGYYDAIVGAVSDLSAGRPARGEAVDAMDSLARALRLDATGDLAEEEYVSNAAVMLFGGIETTEGMIANAIAHLLSHPDQLAAVRAEPELLANAIEESLRLEPAAAVIDRYATRETELGGAQIRERELVVLSIAGANRDPSVFPDPDRFDVGRANARLHTAFAHGPHVCIGMHLARLEAHTAIAQVLERLPGLRLEPGQEATPRGLVFRKPAALRVRWGGGARG